MNLCAEMLLKHWPAEEEALARPERICPAFRHVLGRSGWFSRRPWSFNAERLFNRWCMYPWHLRRRSASCDTFHICDHSYAHLVHELPAARTGVYCHDLDAFRCLLDPAVEPRPAWFRAMSRRIMTGLQRAAIVFYNSHEIGRQLTQSGLIDAARLVHAPLGVADEFQPDEVHDDTAEVLLSALHGERFLLHVGSCIPRKRVDVLIDVLGDLKAKRFPVKLLQVGGEWTTAQRDHIRRRGLMADIVQTKGLDRSTLAVLYRRAALVLLPSEAEGFGLPAIEALACGSLLLASDIPVLHEVAGDAAIYCPVGDSVAFAAAASRLLDDAAAAPAVSTRIDRARLYDWKSHARTIAEAYARLS